LHGDDAAIAPDHSVPQAKLDGSSPRIAYEAVVTARHTGLGLQGQAIAQAMFEDDRGDLVPARIDGREVPLRTKAPVGGLAFVLGDDLGLPARRRPGSGPGRAAQRAKENRRDRQDRGG
jgi:hypothetical protein